MMAPQAQEKQPQMQQMQESEFQQSPDKSQESRPKVYQNYSNQPFNRYNKQTSQSPTTSSYQSLPQRQPTPLPQQQVIEATKQQASQSGQSTFLPFPEEVDQDYCVSNLAEKPFEESITRILNEPINPEEVEIKPDGNIYLPEIKYRKTLIRAFGPGGWVLIPKGPHSMINNVLSGSMHCIVMGSLLASPRSCHTNQYLQTPASSSESARSNALMRCCKDLGIANELWSANLFKSGRQSMQQENKIPLEDKGCSGIRGKASHSYNKRNEERTQCIHTPRFYNQ